MVREKGELYEKNCIPVDFDVDISCRIVPVDSVHILRGCRMYDVTCDEHGWTILYEGYALYKGLTAADAEAILSHLKSFCHGLQWGKKPWK